MPTLSIINKRGITCRPKAPIMNGLVKARPPNSKIADISLLLFKSLSES